MKISGIQKFSLIDYPGMLSTILFTQGCNFKCPWCHNPELVLPEQFKKPLSIPDIFAFLEKRMGKIDAVTITGGEPTLHHDLPQLIKRIKDLGYLVKLDTNGSNPQMLSFLIQNQLVNYIAMDIKSSFDNYSKITHTLVNIDHIKKSIDIIKSSGLDYEFRTTFIPLLMNEDDIHQIEEYLGEVNHYYIQHFEPQKTLDIYYQNTPKISEDLWEKLKENSSNKTYHYFR